MKDKIMKNIVISQEVADTLRSLQSHLFTELYGRFNKNVNTENMPAWDNVWKAYHTHRGLECLRSLR